MSYREESESEEDRFVSYGAFRGLSSSPSNSSNIGTPISNNASSNHLYYGNGNNGNGSNINGANMGSNVNNSNSNIGVSPNPLGITNVAGSPISSKMPLPAGYGALSSAKHLLHENSRNDFSDDEVEYIAARDPVEDALQNCFDQVIRPVAYFLCFLGWRPFPCISSHSHPCYKILDVIYPAMVCSFLGFSYFFGLYYAVSVDRTSLISEYVMEAVVSSFLWVYGMWFFRREEGRAFEELSALIETVYLHSSNITDKLSQDRLTQTLINYLIYAGWTLLFYMGFALWVAITLAMQLIDKNPMTTSQFIVTIIVISIGYVGEHAIYVATIIIYWIICRLHMCYLDAVRDRLMQRNISLNRATREIASIKKLINDTNHGWAVAISFLTFSLAVQAIFIHVRFFEGEQFRFEFVQAGIAFAIAIGLFFAAIFPASLVCWRGQRLKGMSWKLRAEQHYRKSTPEQLDSFLLFCSNTKMHAKIMGFPIWKEYLFLIAGVILVTIFFLWRIGVYGSN